MRKVVTSTVACVWFVYGAEFKQETRRPVFYFLDWQNAHARSTRIFLFLIPTLTFDSPLSLFIFLKNFNDLIRLLAERAQIAQSSRFDLRDFSIFNNQKLLFSFLLCDEGWGDFHPPFHPFRKRQRMCRVPSGTVQISFIYFSRRIRFVFFCCSMPDPSSESSCDVLHRTQNP